MTRRKPHRKSRDGCAQCKQRRVKCDEDRPSCRNCARRKEKCSLSEIASPSREASTTPSSTELRTRLEPSGEHYPNFQEPSPFYSPASQAPHVSRLKELYLMHHYGTVTCMTIVFTPAQLDLWKIAIPRKAMGHQFLMEGLLSLSAFHCAHLEPLASWDYTEAATKYQISGITGYSSALNCINDDNYEAIFAFSIILAILGFGMPTAFMERQSVAPLDHIKSIFELLKGVAITTQTYGEAIKAGIFKPLFMSVNAHSVDDGHQEMAVTVPWRDAKAAMTRLRERVNTITKYVGVEVRDIYVRVIEGLEITFGEVELNGGLSHVVAWPILSGKDIIDPLERKDPMALLLWAHYGVLTLVVHDYWWGRDFGIRLIESLCTTLHSLDPEWMIWTEWVRDCASSVSRV